LANIKTYDWIINVTKEDENVICQDCGTENIKTATQCSVCENKLTAFPSAPDADANKQSSNASKECPTCGKARNDDERTCQSCGEDFSKFFPPPDDPPKPPPKLCPSCAQPNDESAKKCELCGLSFTGKRPRKLIQNYPVFQRSPRISSGDGSRKIVVQLPPMSNEKPQINWLVVFLPPLVMIGVSILAMVLSGGGLTTMLFMIPMTVMTLLTTIISYVTQRRKWQKKSDKLYNAYNEYLAQLDNDIGNLYKMQLSAVNTANPETAYCLDIVKEQMRRLWERSHSDSDFLAVRLGKGELPLSSEITLPATNIGDDINTFIVEAQKIKDKYAIVKDIAITLPLKEVCTVGFIGSRDTVIKTVSNSLVQLATHQSYTDLNIVLLTSEKEWEHFSWIRWLPHVWNNTRTVRFTSSSKAQATELLDHFENVLKQRLETVVSNRSDDVILPYLLFVVTDPALVENNKFLNLISMNNPNMGVGAFLLFDRLERLPKECNCLVELSGSDGSEYTRSNSLNRYSFMLDSFNSYDCFSRFMAPIRDTGSTQSGLLPASVTFFEGYGISQADDIDVLHKWKTSNPNKTLGTQIGTGETGKPFIFDIHEKAHGSHGLVAGTTRAGKSEVLQTWILSMCVNYSPQYVSFVIIDFKGENLAASLKRLPHIAGIISNIGENIQRNMISLYSELGRREKLFKNISTDTMKIGEIYEYHEAYMNGRLSETLPYLFIIVDEFAILKNQYPEFMKSLEEIATKGRYVGIRLLLATQQPDAVVTDAIRTNSKFKWCLKVASESDSKAVIGKPDAVSITNPGRAYIQVGNNEVFELVQTYYSGAIINSENNEERPVAVSFIDSVGRRDTVSLKNPFVDSGQEKELMALVRHISEAHRSSGLPIVRKVWEDNLPNRLYLSDLPKQKSSGYLSAFIGVSDDPKNQSQYATEIDFVNDGNIIVYGKSRAGKTVLLQTIMVSLAEQYNPNEVNAYIMDFGKGDMKKMLEMLPHIGGIANGNEEEKIFNLVKMLTDILNQRKTLFAQVSASDLEIYRRITKEIMPAIIILIDNFAPIREAYPDIENVLIKLTREGSGCGIYFAVTATSLSGNISFNLSQNFAQKLSLRMIEKADYRDIVGNAEGLEPADVAGRGLVSGKSSTMEFQTALAVAASDDVEYSEKIKKRCEQIASQWQGDLPCEIPVMPDIVLPAHVKSHPSGSIAIGLFADDITPVCLTDSRIVLISGTESSGKTNMLRVFAKHYSDDENGVYLVSAKNEDNAAERISKAISKAVDGESIVLIVDDITSWLFDSDYDATDPLENLIGDKRNNKFTLIAAGDASDISRSGHSVIQKMIASGASILLGGCFNDHYSQFEANNLGYSKENEQLEPHCGYYIQKRKAVMFKAVYVGGGDYGL
jgi:S-DNA-T family DNA segregation ATPase FtsK/SpoIIIE